MTDLRFGPTEIELMVSLLNQDAVSIIWDMNAFYFNTRYATYKMECLEARPEGSDYEFDEVFFCGFEKLAEYVDFDDSQPGYCFKTVATNTKIQSIEVIETAHVFPDDVLTNAPASGSGITRVSLGLIIYTNAGVIPALLLPRNYGFTWLEKQRLYTFDDVKELLQNDIKIYDSKPLPH